MQTFLRNPQILKTGNSVKQGCKIQDQHTKWSTVFPYTNEQLEKNVYTIPPKIAQKCNT